LVENLTFVANSNCNSNLTGLHCVADIDMYTEFIITMTIPFVGLVLIIAFYRVRLWQIQQSAVVAEEITDTETGPLQKPGDGLEDTDAAAVRSNRDLCVWLAIGWLFMVRKFVLISYSCAPADVPSGLHTGLHDSLPNDLPELCLQGH
jgi:hypothetical protein